MVHDLNWILLRENKKLPSARDSMAFFDNVMMPIYYVIEKLHYTANISCEFLKAKSSFIANPKNMRLSLCCCCYWYDPHP